MALEQRLTDRFRVALNVVHQLDNALLRQEPEREMAGQVCESEGNPGIPEGAAILACRGDEARKRCFRHLAYDPSGSPHSAKFQSRYWAEMEEFAGTERNSGGRTKRDSF